MLSFFMTFFLVTKLNAQPGIVTYTQGEVFAPAFEHDKFRHWNIIPAEKIGHTLYFIEMNDPTLKKSKNVIHLFDTLGRYTGQLEISDLMVNGKKTNIEHALVFNSKMLLIGQDFSKINRKMTIYYSVLDLLTGIPGPAVEMGTLNQQDSFDNFGAAVSKDGSTLVVNAPDRTSNAKIYTNIILILDKDMKPTTETENFEVPAKHMVNTKSDFSDEKIFYCAYKRTGYREIYEDLALGFKDKKTGDEQKVQISDPDHIVSFNYLMEGKNLAFYYIIGYEDKGFKMRKKIFGPDGKEISTLSLDNIFSETEQEHFFVDKKIEGNYFNIRFTVADLQGNIHLLLENKEVDFKNENGLSENFGDVIYLKLTQELKVLDKKISSRRHTFSNQRMNGYGKFEVQGSHFIFIPYFELFQNQAANENDPQKPLKQSVIKINPKGELTEQELTQYSLDFRKSMKTTFSNGFGPNFRSREIVDGNTVYVLCYSTGPYLAKYTMHP